jgi:hypothetical protein
MPALPKVENWLNNLTGYGHVFEDPTSVPGYMEQEEALRHLQEFTGVDFGYDTERWREWFLANRPSELRRYPPGYEGEERKPIP